MLLPKLTIAYYSILFFTTTTNSGLGVTLLPHDEMEALRDIAKTMGKTDWDFSADPCSGGSGWVANHTKGFEEAVTCNCSFSAASACHVVSIVLKGSSLPGKLPIELVRLPHLQVIQLTRNYLNGTLPPQWGSMKLVSISLGGNRISGTIPKEFANISTLKSLILEDNQLSGSIPLEFGNLRHIERIQLSSNNLSGELPATLGQLTTLKDFRISENHFSGKIPDYIQNWTNLQKLLIQASGLSGPIPSGIAGLVNLTDLVITDLYATEAPLPPPLNKMTKLRALVLRSCNLIGELPAYLGNMTFLKVLDLSFNKLSGEIPENYANLANVQFIYLTRNLLSGPVPDWMLNKGQNIDLSYNSFKTGSTGGCQEHTVNLFGSSTIVNNDGIVPCLKSFRCPKRLYHSLHINCGGKEVTVNGKTYEDDTDSGGPSRFFLSKTNWGYSNTGHFNKIYRPIDSYVWNLSDLSMNNSALYTNARRSPISLTYYGFCMENGNYTVNLHFAEIIFADDTTYGSLGRRVFDVYVQEKLVLEGFNIAGEAGGVGKAVVKKFTAAVTSGTLEIRFHWSGKGTTDVPFSGNYGPLVSAISADPADFIPLSDFGEKGRNRTVHTIMIRIIAVIISLILLLILGIFWWRSGFTNVLQKDSRGIELHTGSFSLRQIQAATNKFNASNKIGEGGFGSVYKGRLSDGTVIAVKQLSSGSKQGNREFVNEVGMISALEHPHLVKLYGCCMEGDQMLLVYEYMENNSLARALFGQEEWRLRLEWPIRQKICIGIARGLAYLHEESRLKIVHRDIKATNVLLDKNLTPKISDFGLAKLDDQDNSHISTRFAGTFGYMAPEYAMRGYLTDKADVYSFGIVALEIASGRSNIDRHSKEERFNLLDRALVLKENGNVLELVDPRLGSEFDKEEATRMINVGLLCTNVSAPERPAMSSVVGMLEGTTEMQDFVPNSSVVDEKMKLEAMRKHYELIREHLT